MDAVLAFLNQAFDWLNLPTVKYAFVLVGGFLWVRNASTINRAYPFVAMVGSIAAGLAKVITAFLANLDAAHTASVASFVASTGASSTTQLIVDAAIGTVLPVIAAVGTHSWWKNALQWLADGYRIRKRP